MTSDDEPADLKPADVPQAMPKSPKASGKDECAKILRSMRGIGIPASIRLVGTFSDDLVKKICAADANGKRSTVGDLINAEANKANAEKVKI